MTEYTIDDIKQANSDAGLHFFELQTIEFFNSIIEDEVYQGNGGIFFVTSEQFEYQGVKHERKFSVRRFFPESGRINTVMGLSKIDRDEAITAATRLADGEV